MRTGDTAYIMPCAESQYYEIKALKAEIERLRSLVVAMTSGGVVGMTHSGEYVEAPSDPSSIE